MRPVPPSWRHPIRTTGNLDKDTEEQLKKVLTAYTDSFVKAH